MKETNINIFCNLCQKNFNQKEFLNHLPNDHLPELNLTCSYCDSQPVSLADLQLHLNSSHRSSDVVQNVFQFSDLFTDSSDIRLHSKQCAEWIQQLFSFDFKNILNKKEIRSVIKRSYTHVYNEYDSDCELCDNVENQNFCGYCSQEFLRKCHLKVHVLRTHILLPDHIKKSMNICDVCRKMYPTKKILMQHHRIHKNLFAQINVDRIKTKLQICTFCNKNFANKSNLNRHTVNQHGEKIGASPNQDVFTCDHCKCSFSNKSSVKRHIENLHLVKERIRKSVSCFHCEQKFNSIKNLNAHLNITHEVKINEEKLQFSHLNEFYSWKQEEEIRTNSRFIQLRGLRKHSKNGEEISTLKFVCNRSGIFHSKSNGKRAYRIKGSSKIGRYCSAYIEILFKGNQSVNGIYCSTHCGHDNDLRYLTLTMNEKREIYEKIKNGSTFSSILNEIRDNVGKEIKRKHLVTNKDLHNIVTTFKRISKPVQDDISPQSSSSSNLLESSNDPSQEKYDQNFNNDLDLCGELWVETCQRMVNRFDQNEPHINDFCKVAKPRNICFVTDTVQQDSRIGINSDFHEAPYANHHDYRLGNSSESNYHSYENQTTKKLNNSTYFNNVAKSANVKQVKDVYSVSVTSNDLRLNRDFYPVDIVDVDSHITDMHVSKCAANYNNDTVDDSQAYFRNTHTYVYDKVPSKANVIMIRSQDPYNSYNYSDKLPTALNLESEHQIYSTNEDFPDTEVICNDTVVSEDESETPVENKNNHEVSDLRDRVNSVTALYNIVESELDERKKKIIRNYVDNMFRVLQHRYNKCRTKKKQDSQEQPANKEKKNKNRLPFADKQRKKKVPDLLPAQFNASTEFASKVPEPSQMNSLNSSPIENQTRTNAEFARWNRY